MSVLGPLRVFVISFAATQCRASLLSRGGGEPLKTPLTAFVDQSSAGPCQCDSFCTGVRAANAQPLQAQPMPAQPIPAPPPSSGYSPSGTIAGPPPAEAGFAKSGRLAGVRSLISLESRPRSESAREALLHGANAALLQQHVAKYAYSSASAGRDAQQQMMADLQPLGPRLEPGMHCNCHCNHDPWFYMRGTAPPFDWSQTPAPPTVLPAPPPCSGTGQEWPGCAPPYRVGGPVLPIGGLPGLPKLLPVESSDLPTLGPAPGVFMPADRGGSAGVRPSDVTGPPPGPPSDPVRPAPPPPDPDPGSPPAVPEITAAGPVKDCIGPKGPIICPPDPANKNGWWGKPRDTSDIYYVAGADPNKQDPLTGR